ncbi:MAG: hypothetical protein ACTSUS_09015 [Candidatus Freyarchaeota archaeon]|nr:ThaI family type II restriction endonuclease [Candidatus Freyrarchaeum guaymaensis]
MTEIDPLIQLLKKKPMVLDLLGRIWEILYIEGSTPDIGKRREHVIRVMLEEEFKLKVKPAPPMEREWDFSVMIGEQEKKYSLKTTETITTVKVAWNGFPSIERARRFKFKYPILYVTRNRKKMKISLYVFEVDDLEELKMEMGDDMWWIPKSETNPRGFGINTTAIKTLIEKAEKKGNFITINYQHVNINAIREKYWKMWYNMLKKLALEC